MSIGNSKLRWDFLLIAVTLATNISTPSILNERVALFWNLNHHDLHSFIQTFMIFALQSTINFKSTTQNIYMSLWQIALNIRISHIPMYVWGTSFYLLWFSSAKRYFRNKLNGTLYKISVWLPLAVPPP